MQSPEPWQDACMAQRPASQLSPELAGMVQRQREPCDAPCCSWRGDTPGMHHNELGTSLFSSSRAGRGFTSTPCAALSAQVDDDGAGGEAVATEAAGRCLQRTQPCPQRWGMLQLGCALFPGPAGSELPWGEAAFCDSTPWGIWDYGWTNGRKSTLQARY